VKPSFRPLILPVIAWAVIAWMVLLTLLWSLAQVLPEGW
jgi:hypothetical protein